MNQAKVLQVYIMKILFLVMMHEHVFKVMKQNTKEKVKSALGLIWCESYSSRSLQKLSDFHGGFNWDL